MATSTSWIEDFAPLLNALVQVCDAAHSDKCRVTPISKRALRHIPDWVIDTIDGRIVAGNSVEQYAALSYVWNPPPVSNEAISSQPHEPMVLTSENLHDFQKPGFLLSSGPAFANLPLVIQEAISLVAKSPFRYLWIDRLCILQNDVVTAAGVALMTHIYSGASLTIIAAASAAGLWAKLEPGRNVELTRLATQKYGWLSQHDLCIGSLHSALLDTYWATRGWTFQEQLLSKRAIIFLDEVVFWDCQCCVWWPEPATTFAPMTWKQNTERSNVKDLSNYRSQDAHIRMYPLDTRLQEFEASRKLSEALVSLTAPNFRLYTELIYRFNYRDFTTPQDALAAFSGVLDAFTCGFRGSFVSGLPALLLDTALLWQPLFQAKRRVANGDLGSNIASPSWSWIGWQCIIDPESLQTGLDYEVSTHPSRYLSEFWESEEHPWRTMNLVDWYVLEDECDKEGEILTEPAMLQRCKDLGCDNHGPAPCLPLGWKVVTHAPVVPMHFPWTPVQESYMYQGRTAASELFSAQPVLRRKSRHPSSRAKQSSHARERN